MALEIKIIKKKDYVYVVELKGSPDTETRTLFQKKMNEINDNNTNTDIEHI